MKSMLEYSSMKLIIYWYPSFDAGTIGPAISVWMRSKGLVAGILFSSDDFGLVVILLCVQVLHVPGFVLSEIVMPSVTDCRLRISV